MSNLKPLVRYGILAGIAMAGASAASAGSWKLDPARCPDLREDRADMRVTHNRADQREDVRDMRVVNCPQSAWAYVPGPKEKLSRKMTYKGPKTVYVGKAGYYRYTPKADGKPPAPVLINVIVR